MGTEQGIRQHPLIAAVGRRWGLLLDVAYLGFVLWVGGLLLTRDFLDGAGFTAMLMLPLVVVAWIVMLIVSVCVRKHTSNWRAIFRLMLPIVVIPIAVTLSVTGQSLQTAIWVSRPSMDRLAREVIDAPRGTAFQWRWVGVFQADDIRRTEWGMQFSVRRIFTNEEWGFAYCPAGVPSEDGPRGSTHFKSMGDGWFRYQTHP